LVQFFDAKSGPAKCVLRSHNYILRERSDLDNEFNNSPPTLTLKYRNPDRLLVAYKNILAEDTKLKDTKFEEDISPIPSDMPSFKSIYSRSGKLKLNSSLSEDGNAKLKKLFCDSKLPSLKEGLKEEGLKVNQIQEKGFQVVNTKQIYERVFKGELRSPIHKIGFDLTLWFKGPAPADDEKPFIAEISFGYQKSRNDKFPPRVGPFHVPPVP